MLHSVITALNKVVKVNKWLNSAGMIAVFLMVLATCCDVFMRYVFNQPITGVYEYAAACLVLVVFFGIAYTQEQRSHITVDLFTQKLSDRNRTINDIGNNVLCFLLAILMIFASIKEVQYFISDSASTNSSVYVPALPFGIVMVIGCVLFALVFLRDILQGIENGCAQKLKAGQWILAFLIPAAVVAVVFILVFSDIKWNVTAIGVIGIVVSLLFMFAGMPISMAFMLSGVVFISIIRNPSTMMSLVSTTMFSQTSSYSWTVMPFFLLMGFLCFEFDYGKDLYEMAYKWVGRLYGGLAISTVTACAGFAAIVGNGSAPCVTMGSVALPEMRKYKYNEELSTGTIIGGCSLGPIIPPSQPLIIYAMLTQQSVGTLFVASLVPGIILWLIFSIYIYILCRIRPQMGPKGEKSSGREKLAALKKGIPVLLIFLVVIFGIFAGVFSATEAGAIGCALVLIIAIIQRRLTWTKLKNALIETGKATAMIFMILIGASLLGKVITLSRLPNMLIAIIGQLSMNPHLAVIAILAVFFFLGFFVDIMPLMLIGIPVVHPAIVALGFNPVWFTIVLTITICMGTITPPVGINLFTLKGVAKDVPIQTLFRGALPFTLLTCVLIVIIYLIPPIITWLPGVLS